MTVIRPATMNEYLGSRAHRFSSDALAFDDPSRPRPSPEEEREWWRRDVDSGRYVCHAILDSGVVGGLERGAGGRLIGFIRAFCFDSLPAACETGINIFPSALWNRDLAARTLAAPSRPTGGHP